MADLHKSFKIRPFQAEDKDDIAKLWKDCDLVVPLNDPIRDINTKIQFQPDLFLVGELNNKVIASVMIGYEGHRGWINYLAVSPLFQNNGLGKLLMNKAEDMLQEMGCLKINLQVREHNTQVIEFYRNLGYQDDHVISMGKRLT